jgi:hypothetical protein
MATGTDSMTQPIERRKGERRTEEEELSPEYLELLEVCGGDIRARDRAMLASRRTGAALSEGSPAAERLGGADSGQPPAESAAEEPVAPAADRRARSG